VIDSLVRRTIYPVANDLRPHESGTRCPGGGGEGGTTAPVSEIYYEQFPAPYRTTPKPSIPYRLALYSTVVLESAPDTRIMTPSSNARPSRLTDRTAVTEVAHCSGDSGVGNWTTREDTCISSCVRSTGRSRAQITIENTRLRTSARISDCITSTNPSQTVARVVSDATMAAGHSARSAIRSSYFARFLSTNVTVKNAGVSYAVYLTGVFTHPIFVQHRTLQDALVHAPCRPKRRSLGPYIGTSNSCAGPWNVGRDIQRKVRSTL